MTSTINRQMIRRLTCLKLSERSAVRSTASFVHMKVMGIEHGIMGMEYFPKYQHNSVYSYTIRHSCLYQHSNTIMRCI